MNIFDDLPTAERAEELRRARFEIATYGFFAPEEALKHQRALERAQKRMQEEGDDDIANRLDPQTLAVSAVIGTGDDLASKGKEAPKQAGGGNPWNVNESSFGLPSVLALVQT
mgnify:CR=1 FL=1